MCICKGLLFEQVFPLYETFACMLLPLGPTNTSKILRGLDKTRINIGTALYGFIYRRTVKAL